MWDIINSYEYDINPQNAERLQADVLKLAIETDRRGPIASKFTDFFQKAQSKGVFTAAVDHVVKECRLRLSGFFQSIRAAGLPMTCSLYGYGRSLDRNLPIV